MDSSLSSRVYDSIIGQLHRRELVPGQVLNRRSLAEQVGVSVAPVLEALVRLESEGFVETMPRKGTRVRRISLDDVLGVLTVRQALEVEGARLYCGAPVRGEERDLSKLAAEVDRAAPSSLENWQLDLEFHRRLMQLTECRALLEAFDRVVNLAWFHAANDLSPPRSKKLDPHSHVKLMEVLAGDDPDAAAGAMRRHLSMRLLHLRVNG
jgi:DNA-binding GntR family transcriptional regulator